MKRYVYLVSQDNRADVHLETDDLEWALGWARGRAQELAARRGSTWHVVVMDRTQPVIEPRRVAWQNVYYRDSQGLAIG